MTSNYSDTEIKTKEIYINQHKNYHKDKSIFRRHLKSATDLATYDVTSDYFQGKSILDAGCGNTGYFQVAMFRLGAKHVTCLDIGDDWKDEMARVLNENKIPKEFYDFIAGSTLELPSPEKSFDFVASNGVIMHLETIQKASLAISELSRVTKNGGGVYSHIGIDKPGIVDKYIVKALRQAYQEDEKFRKFIDNINPESINNELSLIYNDCQKYDPRLNEFLSKLSNLITLDTTTFWQNMLQVPVQQGPFLSEEWGRAEMTKNSLVNIRRPKESYWVRNDFRHLLAPLHYSLESPIARLFYGNGHVKLMADKIQ